MVYNDNHKIVLQTIIHNGALNANDGKKLVLKLFGDDNTAQVISEINAKLRPLDMTIKCMNCEVTSEPYWVLANTVQDSTFKFYLEYSEAELTLIRNVFSEIITSNNGYVSSTWCLNLCSSLNPKLSKANADKFLHQMVEKKWLSYKDGQYYIGVRSIAELFQYFKDAYEDNLRTCTLCKQAIFYGMKCEQCNAVTHVHCLKSCTMDKDSLGCPNCHSSTSKLDYLDNNTNSAMDIDDADVEVGLSRQKRLKRKCRD